MKRLLPPGLYTLAFILGTLVFSASATSAEDVAITRIAATDGGKSTFESQALTWQSLATVAGNLQVSALRASKTMTLMQFPPGFNSGWHLTPDDQYLIILQGRLEVSVSSGESRTFAAGEILRFSDASGDGHLTRSLSADRNTIVLLLPFAGSD